MLQETWKNIEGYDGIYFVSNFGRIKSSGNGERKRCESILKGVKNKFGYLIVGLSKNGHQSSKYIHRLVAEAFLGKSELNVNHKNGIKTDNRIDNLEYVSSRENTIHYHKSKGRKFTGVIKRGCKYSATAYLNGKNRYLGIFDTELEAHNAYLKAVKNFEGGII